MTMTGNQRVFLLVYLCAGVLDIAINLLLVPSLGMTGAAIASTLSLAALNLVMYSFARRKLRLKISTFIF